MVSVALAGANLWPLVLGHPLGLAGRLTAALLSAGLAWFTLRFLENPLRFAPEIRNSPWRSLGLGGLATTIAVCVGLVLLHLAPTPVGHGAPAIPLNFTGSTAPAGDGMDAHDAAVREAFAQVQAAVGASADLKDVPPNLTPSFANVGSEKDALLLDGCLRTPFQAGQPECASGDTASSTTVALIGDSHAAMWNPAFERVAEQRHWRLETLAKGACPVLDLPSTNPFHRLVESSTHCKQWRGQILARLRAEHPQLVVVSMWRGYEARNRGPSGFSSYGSAWIDSLTRLVMELRANGSQVLVLGPVPIPRFVVPICLSGYLDDVPACTPSRSIAVNESGIAAESAATQAGGGQYADLTDLFCTTDRCPVIVGNTLVYLDENHLTLEYARVLAPVMGALTERAFTHS